MDMLKPTIIVDVVVVANRELLARWVATKQRPPKSRTHLLDGFAHYCRLHGTLRLQLRKFAHDRWEQGLSVVDAYCPELWPEVEFA